MTELYKPASEFLRAIVSGDVPLGGGEFGEANLRALVAMTGDPDRSNRDWATMLLAQQEIDTAEVRRALLQAARDEDSYVRAEAILGLAERDRDLALPLMQEALAHPTVAIVIFDAAAVLAHPSLVSDLRRFAAKPHADWTDEVVAEALRACESGAVPAWACPDDPSAVRGDSCT